MQNGDGKTKNKRISIVDREGSRVVLFSHLSVKEFLTSKRCDGGWRSVTVSHPPRTCTHYHGPGLLLVLLRLGDCVNEKSAKIPLAEYAAGH